MGTNWGKEKKTQRDKVLELLWDMYWHHHNELADVGGHRYSARVLELKRLGYSIDTRHFKGEKKMGKEYRLLDRVPGTPKTKRVKVFFEEHDAEVLLRGGKLTEAAESQLRSALRSFRVNKGSL